MDTRRSEREAAPTSGTRGALIFGAVLLITSAACTEPPSVPVASTVTASPSTAHEDPAPVPTPTPDLYLIDPETKEARLLLRAPGIQTDPELSPDGTRIAYESRSGGPSQIFVLRANGTTRQLTHGNGGAHDPTWSPDGNQIAFASRPRKRSKPDIFVMDANGSHVRRLVGTSRNDGHPDWSPDGSRIAFHSRYERNRVPGGLIWVASVRTRTLTRLTWDHGSWAEADPTWSPDGQWIAYSRFQRSTINGRIPRAEVWRMLADGTHPKRIGKLAYFDHLSQSPSWSPDGNWIVFEHERNPVYSFEYKYDAGVRAINVRTGRLRTVLDNAVDGQPSWSPRGILVSLSEPVP